MRKIRKPIERLVAARKKLQQIKENIYYTELEVSLDEDSGSWHVIAHNGEFAKGWSEGDPEDENEAIAMATLMNPAIVDVLLSIVGSAEFAAMSSTGTQDRTALKLADAILKTGEPKEE